MNTNIPSWKPVRTCRVEQSVRASKGVAKEAYYSTGHAGLRRELRSSPGHGLIRNNYVLDSLQPNRHALMGKLPWRKRVEY
jgi:hypothetical protein